MGIAGEIATLFYNALYIYSTHIFTCKSHRSSHCLDTEVQTAQGLRVCVNSVRTEVFRLRVFSYYFVERMTDGHTSTATGGATVTDVEL